MTMTEDRRGAHGAPGNKTGSTAAAGESAGAGTGTGTEGTAAAGSAGRAKGFSLFGERPPSHEAMVSGLASFLKGEPAAVAPAGEEEEESTTEGTEGTEKTGDEGDGETTEGTEGTETEEQEPIEGESEPGEEPSAGKEWPQEAIAKIAEQRAKRRETEAKLQERDEELSRMRTRLESEELKRPLAPTPENPLAFAQTPQALQQWATSAREIVALIEDQLDGSLAPGDRPQLERWAKANGAWDPQGEDGSGGFDAGALKRTKRNALAALQNDLPQRQQYFDAERTVTAQVEKDPVLGPIWAEKEAQPYQDAMGVLNRMPSVRQFPEWKAMAGIYALGLSEYRKRQAVTAGKGGTGGSGGSGGTAGKGGLGANGKPTARPAAAPGAVRVNSPGRTVVAPRNVAAPKDVAAQGLRERIKSGKATGADMKDYTLAALTGKIPRVE